MHIPRLGRAIFLLLALTGVVATTAAFASEAKPSDVDSARLQITELLTTFLTPAVNNTAAGHDRFWADDMVYTSSAGMVMSKADIMKSFADAPKPDASQKQEPGPVFTAEDILVRSYGDMAALTFRLVEHDPDGKVSTFRNSGTFVRRGGKWKAVTWQATRVVAIGN